MPPKIVIDTDPGVDDVLAILLGIASSSQVDLALISIVFGNTHAPTAYQNLLKIYYILSKELDASPTAPERFKRLTQTPKTVLALGEDEPIAGAKAVAAYFHGQDGLSNVSETHPEFTPPEIAGDHPYLERTKVPAYQAILDLLRNEPEQTVTIVALGPLTNVAHALRAEPETFARVKDVVWMGGTLEHPGNTSPTAEFNCFADPYAASQVLDACKSGAFRLIMAPLDITTPHSVPFSRLLHPNFIPQADGKLPRPIPGSNPTPMREFISAMLLRVRGLQASFGLPDAMEMHDPLAVWYAVSHASLPGGELAPGWQVTPRDFKIERTGELTRGMCVVDRRGQNDSGEDRTKDSRLAGNTIPPPVPTAQGEAGDKEDKGRMGEPLVKAQALPLIITKTPGKEVLGDVLLENVFGKDQLDREARELSAEQ